LTSPALSEAGRFAADRACRFVVWGGIDCALVMTVSGSSTPCITGRNGGVTVAWSKAGARQDFND